MTFSLKVQYIFVIVTTSKSRFLSSCETTHCKFKNSLWQGFRRLGVTDYTKQTEFKETEKELEFHSTPSKSVLATIVSKLLVSNYSVFSCDIVGIEY